MKMKLWKFRRKTHADSNPYPKTSEPSTMDRLLSRNCNRDEFFLLYFKLLQEMMPSHKLEMAGESVVRCINAHGEESTTYMDNAWLYYAQNTEDRKEMLERYLRLAVTIDEPSESVAPERIVAMIKDAHYVSMFKSQNRPYMEHLCGDLWIVYAEDLPESMRSLTQTDVAAAGMDEVSLKELAKDNLRKIMPPAERHGDGPWYLLTAGGDYTASLLLFDGLWGDLADSVDGEVVAVVPSRDVILYTGSLSAVGLIAIRERAQEILKSGSYLISDTLLVRRDGRWDIFNAN